MMHIMNFIVPYAKLIYRWNGPMNDGLITIYILKRKDYSM